GRVFHCFANETQWCTRRANSVGQRPRPSLWYVVGRPLARFPLDHKRLHSGLPMTSDTTTSRTLPIVITVLALADALLHLMLDVVLFRGNFWGPLGPPPGAPAGGPPPGAGPPPLPLPLNQLFVLNFVGYLVLIVAFWLAPRWLGRWSWVVDLAFIA